MVLSNVTVLCVGKLKEKYLRDACAEYEKRLGAYCKLAIVEVDEERMPENPSAAQIEKAIAAEGKRLIGKIPSGAHVTALCIEGKMLSSPELAERFERLALEGMSHEVLIIGGSWGLSNEVKATSTLKLSMSPMTFPHQLARMMLLEQVYRAMQIATGGKYHK